MSKQIKKVTIEDIAMYAGVSTATVSRALSDSTSIKESTKLRIIEIANEHKYAVNHSAKLLSRQKSNTIALFLPIFTYNLPNSAPIASDPFFLKVFSGILSQVGKLDKELLVSNFENKKNAKLVQAVRSKKADGIIIYGGDANDWANDPIVDDEFPVVFWGGSRSNPFHWLASDEILGGEIAAEALIDAGCKNLAYIGGNDTAFEAQGRLTGFKQYIEKQGMTLKESNISFEHYFPHSGFNQMNRLLESDPTIDGVFASADVLALSAMNAIQNKGLRIPEDIKIVGFDDIDGAAVNNPSLTTISQDGFEAGKALVNRIIDIVEDRPITAKHECLGLKLIKRNSC
ncbi:LacI family DNA-binding transcriptional regulator [Marinicellulosiphila megalodicopiae]|uniref:LacI family DNA-binding transcriptional regulator n=1 Tax=Marinicellulosiphila megalodicopiae TaxID=2724896 RepID=UPI003BAF9AB0